MSEQPILSNPILSREELAASLDDLRISGVTDRVTASESERIILEHDEALRAEVSRLREALALIASDDYDAERDGEQQEIAAAALAPQEDPQ
jgi:hypothetical protein